MDQGEQHFVALRLQFEGDAAGVSPGEGELARRIKLGDAALQAMLVAKAFRPLAGRIGQLVVAPDQFERRADLHFHLPRR